MPPTNDPFAVIDALLKRADRTEQHLADTMRAELGDMRTTIAAELQGARADAASALRTLVHVITLVALVALVLMAALVGVTLQVQSGGMTAGVNATAPATAAPAEE